MIIERHKANTETAKLLDAAGLSHYATLEIPDADVFVEAKKQKKSANDVAVIVAVAKRLYGGDRKIGAEMA